MAITEPMDGCAMCVRMLFGATCHASRSVLCMLSNYARQPLEPLPVVADRIILLGVLLALTRQKWEFWGTKMAKSRYQLGYDSAHVVTTMAKLTPLPNNHRTLGMQVANLFGTSLLDGMGTM